MNNENINNNEENVKKDEIEETETEDVDIEDIDLEDQEEEDDFVEEEEADKFSNMDEEMAIPMYATKYETNVPKYFTSCKIQFGNV